MKCLILQMLSLIKLNDLENLYFDASVRPVFRGNIATVSYIDLDPSGPATVSVVIDRPAH